MVEPRWETRDPLQTLVEKAGGGGEVGFETPGSWICQYD